MDLLKHLLQEHLMFNLTKIRSVRNSQISSICPTSQSVVHASGLMTALLGVLALAACGGGGGHEDGEGQGRDTKSFDLVHVICSFNVDGNGRFGKVDHWKTRCAVDVTAY